MRPPIRYAQASDGARIAYAVHGQGPPLVYARGWISHLDLLWDDPEFAPFFDAIGQHFTVIRYDVRGNGLSDRDVVGRLGLDDLVLDLEAVADKTLGDAEPFTLWASCYGGPIAARYAARHPDRVNRLIIDGSYARGAEVSTPDMREAVLGMVRMLEMQPGAGFAMLDYFTNPDPDDLRAMRMERLRHAINAKVAGELYELAFELDVVDDLLAVRSPTLVLHRKGTRAVPFDRGQRLASLIPDATFRALDGRAHNLWEGEATEALRALGEWLGAPILQSFQPRTPIQPTVVLFTDIEGSTSMTAAMGDSSAQQVVRVHNSVFDALLDANGGRKIKNTGDGLMAAFASVSQAVRCAVEAQRAFARHNASHPDAPVQVRMGLNAGEPLSEFDDLYGLVVNTAARICDAADGGQILVSNVVRELSIGKRFTFVDQGTFTLKGIGDGVRLFSVDWDADAAGQA